MQLNSGSVVALTGAASGIGQALAVLLSRRGVIVALSDVDAAGLEETATLCESTTSAHIVDVGDRNAVIAWRDSVVAIHGHCDGIINNAGFALAGTTVADVTYEQFHRIMDVNFWGVVHGTKAFLDHFIGREDRAPCFVVNISSIFGLGGMPRNGPYCSSKFAVRGFTEALRNELLVQGMDHVQVVCVHPAGIKTNVGQKSLVSDDDSGTRLVGEQEARRMGYSRKAIKEGVSIDTVMARFNKKLTISPETAATIIIRSVERGDTRVLIGREAYGLDRLVRLMPQNYFSTLVSLMDLQTDPRARRRVAWKASATGMVLASGTAMALAVGRRVVAKL